MTDTTTTPAAGTSKAFDPADHTVDEIKAHYESADDAERARVLEAEKGGRGRAGVAALGEASAEAAAPASLSTKRILAVVNDGEEDDDTAEALQKALYRFGAQDPSREFPRSWQRVQRRLGVEGKEMDGVATAEQVAQFADRAGITVTK